MRPGCNPLASPPRSCATWADRHPSGQTGSTAGRTRNLATIRPPHAGSTRALHCRYAPLSIRASAIMGLPDRSKGSVRRRGQAMCPLSDHGCYAQSWLTVYEQKKVSGCFCYILQSVRAWTLCKTPSDRHLLAHFDHPVRWQAIKGCGIGRRPGQGNKDPLLPERQPLMPG